MVIRPATQKPAMGIPIQSTALPSTMTIAEQNHGDAIAPTHACGLSGERAARASVRHLITEISGCVASSVWVKT